MKITNVTQKEFNEIYDKGIEANDLNLTDSNIRPIEMIDSAIIKMFRGNLTNEEIKDLLIKAVNNIENDIIDGYIKGGTSHE